MGQNRTASQVEALEKRRVARQLQACARYLVDSERDDFYQYVSEGNDPNKHIFKSAYVALNGTDQFKALVQQLQANGDTVSF